MRKPFTDDGPNQPLSLIIDCDDPFANRDSIGEGYNSGAGFELCVNNKTWHQSGVQSANVLDRRPDLIRLCCGCNLFSYSSHTPSHSSRGFLTSRIRRSSSNAPLTDVGCAMPYDLTRTSSATTGESELCCGVER